MKQELETARNNNQNIVAMLWGFAMFLVILLEIFIFFSDVEGLLYYSGLNRGWPIEIDTVK